MFSFPRPWSRPRQSSAGRPAARRQPRRARPAVEPLESRELLASTVWSSLIGGSALEQGYKIAQIPLNSSTNPGDIVIVGSTTSTDLPVTNGSTNKGGLEIYAACFDGTTGTRVWATYYGGTGDDIANDVAVDVTKPGAANTPGNIYIVGTTTSQSGFATTGQTAFGGLTDAFVLELTAAGAVGYATYFGSTGNETGNGIAVQWDYIPVGGPPPVETLTEFVYITGSTNSPTAGGPGTAPIPGLNPFPLTSFQSTYGGGNSDAYVAQLTAAGTLAISSYVGGTTDEVGNDIVVQDGAPAMPPMMGMLPMGPGNIYIVGITTGTAGMANLGDGNAALAAALATAPQPTYGGGPHDAFLLKLTANNNNSQRWNTAGYATYLGGEGDDQGLALALAANNSVDVTGFTNSTMNIGSVSVPAVVQPTFAGGALDAFVAQYSSTGAKNWGTWLGTAGDDRANDIDLDFNGNIVITGSTTSTSFYRTLGNPPTNTVIGGTQLGYGGGATDTFVTELNPGGTAMLFSTYLGGGSLDSGNGVVFTGANIFVGGTTNSANFPNTQSNLTVPFAGGTDAFVTKLSLTTTSNWVFAIGTDGQAHVDKLSTGGPASVTGIPVGPYFNPLAPGVMHDVLMSTDPTTNLPILFGISSDSQVYMEKVDSSGNPITSWTLVASGKFLDLQLVTDFNGRPFLAGLSTNSMVYILPFTVSGGVLTPVGGWTLVAPGIFTELRLTFDPNFNPVLLGLANDKQLYFIRTAPSGGLPTPSTAWLLTAKGHFNNFTAIRLGSGVPFVAGVNSDDSRVYYMNWAFTNSKVAPASTWVLAGPGKFIGSVQVEQDVAVNPFLAAISTDHQVYAMAFTSTSGAPTPATGSWFRVAFGQFSSFQLTRNAGTGNPLLFGIKSSDNQVYELQFNNSDAATTPWTLTGALVVQKFTATNFPGPLRLYSIGAADNKLYFMLFNGVAPITAWINGAPNKIKTLGID